MAKQIVAKDIKVEEYEFTDIDGNHLFSVRFNPTDVNIVRRYDDLVKWMESVTISDDMDNDEILKLSDELSKKIDYFLGVKNASDICEFMNPFSPMEDGRLYIETALDNVCNLIESEMGVRMKKVNTRIKKFTQKYEPKKATESVS